MKRLLTILFLSLFCVMSYAQRKGDYYDMAYKLAGKHQIDSSFIYLDSLATKYADKNLYLYYNLTVNPRFRQMHQDKRWDELMNKILKAKHEVEDTLTLQCPQKKDVEKTITAEAKYYKMCVDINVKEKNLKVDGTVTVNFNKKAYIDFALWKYSTVKDIKVNGKDANIDFTPESKFQWMPQAGRLRVNKDNSDKATIHFTYTAHIDSVEAWMAACDTNLVMLSMYMPWYPHNLDSEHFTGDIIFKIDDNFKVSGSSLISKRDKQWVMHQPWEGFDFEFIAAPNLKSRVVKSQGKSIEIDYLSFEEADADSLANACQEIFNYYSKLYQVVPETKELKVVLLPDLGGAISRRNFIVAEAYVFNEDLFKLMAHEIGHFWWQYAPADNWLDWMNESFAEYSSLRAIKHHFGDALFNDYVKAYRESVRKVCPIMELDRNAPDAHKVFYNKGAIVLYDLQKKVGDEKFFKFMQTLAKSHVDTHVQLMNIAKNTMGSKWASWIEMRLQQ